MQEQDSALVTDPRTVHIADVSGMTPTEVVERAEELSAQYGDSVSEELTEGDNEATLVELIDSEATLVELGLEDDDSDDDDESLGDNTL